MKAAIYARVSTDNQDADNQIAQLTSWVTSRGWEMAGIFKERDTKPPVPIFTTER